MSSNRTEDVYDTTREQPVTYICKRCQKAGRTESIRQIIYQVRTIRREWWSPNVQKLCRSVHKTWSLEGVALETGADAPAQTCHCGAYMEARPIRGRYSAAHKCGSRCTHAKSGDCECQCGGTNHGKGYR